MNVGKRIAEIQGIKYKKYCLVYCPYCKTKQMMINITDNRAYCRHCRKGISTAEELLRVIEEDWLDDHRAAKYESKDNKGVGYN